MLFVQTICGNCIDTDLNSSFVLKVEAKAVPIIKDMSEERRVKRLSRYDTEGSLVFGGLPPPRLDIPYQVTVKEKDLYHAISMIKVLYCIVFKYLYSAPQQP